MSNRKKRVTIARRRSTLRPIIFAAVLLGACSDSTTSREPVQIRRWDMVANVASVDYGTARASYQTSAAGDLPVGPMTLTLEDGRTLAVPADTLGGNFCVQFLDAKDRANLVGLPAPSEADTLAFLHRSDTTCTVIAGLSDAHTVEWFEIVAPAAGGDSLDVGYVDHVDGTTITTTKGWQFQLADDFQLWCYEKKLDLSLIHI